MGQNQDGASDSRENTADQIMAGFGTLPGTINDIDGVLGRQRFTTFAKLLNEIDNQAHPQKTGFSENVSQTQRKDVIWMQLAGAGQELILAWNLMRLAAPAAARRSTRVALEYFSIGILEGLPIAHIRANCRDFPKKEIPLWQMSIPPISLVDGGSEKPLIPSSKFPHILKDVLPTFPGWDLEKADQLGDYMQSNLHPFAHGSANALAYMISGTTVENPIMGNVFDAQHPEIYRELADELINVAVVFQDILTGASSFLGRNS